MANFSDNNGRNWVVTLNVHAMKTIKQTLDIDLLADEGPEILQRLSDDIELAVNVLYLAIKEQLDTASISDEQFGKSLGGDCLNEAVGALVQAMIDFFPNPQKREFLSKLWQKSTKHLERTNKEMLAMLEDERVEESIKQRIEEAKEESIQNAISGVNSTVLQGSSLSTPDPLPTESSHG